MTTARTNWERSDNASIVRARQWGPTERVHIRPIQLRAQLHLVSPDAVVSWIHCARVGKWEGHANGAFEFTPEDLKQACVNFSSQKNAIPLTYDHPDADGRQPIEKAGWVHDLRMRGDQLYALCEFTDEAVRLNRRGSYKFCSISFHPASKSRETKEEIGMEINEIGLTDSPFIDGLDPIRLNRNGGATGGNKMKAKKVTHGSIALGIDVKAIVNAINQMEGDITGDRIKKMVDAEVARQEAISGEGSDAPPAPEGEPEKAELSAATGGTKLADEAPPADAPPADAPASGADAAMKAIADAAGMDVAAVIAALTEKAVEIGAVLKGAAPGADVVGMSQELSIMRKQLSTLTAERDATHRQVAEAVATAKVDGLVKSGKVLEADRKEWMTLAVESPDRFVRLAATISPAVPTGSLTGLGSGQREQGITAPEHAEQVKQMRVALSAAGFHGKDQDKHILNALAHLGGDAA